MSSSSSCLCCFSGNLQIKSCPIRGYLSGITTSTPPLVMCCQRYMATGSTIEQITTSGSVSLILSQCLSTSLWKLLIVVGMASFQSAWSSSDRLLKMLVILSTYLFASEMLTGPVWPIFFIIIIISNVDDLRVLLSHNGENAL